MIYADNAATTQLDIDAFEAMKPFLLENYANPSGAYSYSRKAKQAIKEARKTIAECINAEPEQIYFTSGGTESDNWAIKGFAFADKSLIAFREIHDFFGGIIFSPCVFVVHRKPFLFLTSLFYSLYAFYLLKRFRLARRVGGPLGKSE